MDWPRAKTIIISLLLIVNIFLLATYIMRESDARKDELALRNNVCQILKKQGISASPDVLPVDSMQIRPSTVKTGENTEEIAKRLLFDVSTSPESESVVYSGERGNIMFLKDSFSLVYELGEEVISEEDALLFAGEIAKKLGVKTQQEAFSAESAESGYTVRIPQIFSGIRIFGSDIEIKISKSGSVIGSGKFIGHGGLEHTEGETLLASALMIKFADGLRDRGITSLRIAEIRHGYVAETPVGGVVPLVPTLNIRTDGGDFFINMTDGSFFEI